MYYDDELPAGFQDADFEMRELEALADEALARDRREAAAKAAAEQATQITTAVVDDWGKKVTVYIQRTHDGHHWATKGKANSDKGYTLFSNGTAVKQTYKNGELLTGHKCGTWVPA